MPKLSHLLQTRSIESLIAVSEDQHFRKIGPGVWMVFGIGASSALASSSAGTAVAERRCYSFILHAPVLDLILHGTKTLPR